MNIQFVYFFLTIFLVIFHSFPWLQTSYMKYLEMNVFIFSLLNFFTSFPFSPYGTILKTKQQNRGGHMKISTHCKEQWINSICLLVRMTSSHSWWGFICLSLLIRLPPSTMWGRWLFYSCFYFQTQKNLIHIWCI